MAGGGFTAASAGARASQYESKMTIYVVITCIIAASGGLMFGYDVGVSGGVTSMDEFLAKFFPSVLKKKQASNSSSVYCDYDSQTLQLFTSSLYLAALISTFFASTVTRRYGRKMTMLIGGLFFDAGVVLNGAAQDLVMLIIGRILLGCGVGFVNQAVPLFLSEIAPAHLRGGLNILFQLNVTIGILVAELVNYGALKVKPWGWRISLSLAGVPGVVLTLGSFLLVETPNSLVERGYVEEAKSVLRRIRGTDNIHAEFEDLVEASNTAKQVKHPFRNLIKRRNLPQLVITCCLQFFQQFTGINAIMFYAPVIFKTLGFGDDASLYSSVITGGVNVLSTLVSVYSVDKIGRKMLLLEACVQMFISQVAIAILLAHGFKDGQTTLPTSSAIPVVVLICVFVSAFAWSWGPLGWLIASEIFPLETRSAGQSVTVCVNMVFTFVIAQAFLSMLCSFEYGIFLFFASWVVIMGLFTIFFIPETKGIPIEEMEMVWRQHWFWKKIVPDDMPGHGATNEKALELKNVKVAPGEVA
ncbi:hypothetical protein KP509_16G056500 [Ceratopteris richardii]|uniref:Major facilitator superfamily (MFS) profile domain-containing protein n=2 Tax=Ceratopteris richardii TaxID=49495 RepID=A0A8T2SZV6_CERRI|nr:hypothetical protein KP509_16G056500 [Ceratopteris richardii]